jgi:hypothetical protein
MTLSVYHLQYITHRAYDGSLLRYLVTKTPEALPIEFYLMTWVSPILTQNSLFLEIRPIHPISRQPFTREEAFGQVQQTVNDLESLGYLLLV